jgi:hypothetical protein
MYPEQGLRGMPISGALRRGCTIPSAEERVLSKVSAHFCITRGSVSIKASVPHVACDIALIIAGRVPIAG